MLKRVCDRCGADIPNNSGQVISFDMKRYDLCDHCVKPFKVFMKLTNPEEDSGKMFKQALDRAFTSSPDLTCDMCGQTMSKGYATQKDGKIRRVCVSCYKKLMRGGSYE